MKSKGPVDFFLGVFLEFGAAFCLLFFLPHVPWHWVPAENKGTSDDPAPLIDHTATEQRVLLRPAQPTLATSRLSQTVPRTLAAPALLQPVLEPLVDSPAAAPLPTNISQQPQPPEFRRDFPRQYRY